MNMFRYFYLFLSIIILNSCSASYKKLKTVNVDNPVSFNEHLLNQYKLKAIFEADEMHDWNSAKLYSEKALRAQKGEDIYPEKISYWKLPSDRVKDIKIGYFNLLNIYDEAKATDPLNLAIAISSLDCWSEQQEENWQTWDINKCKNDFLNAMHNLYNQIIEEKNNEKIKTDTNKESVVLVPKNKNNQVSQIIYFDFDESRLSEVSINTIKNYLKKYKSSIKKYIIIGHADTKGTKEYNKILSFKRAETVKSILIQEGINDSIIKILGKGEESLAIPTADEVKHPANRRAEIKPLN